MNKMHAAAAALAALALSLPATAQMSSPGKSGPSTAPSSSPRGGTTGSATSDAKSGASEAMLTAKVHAAMARDPGLKTLAINVDSEGNNVTLKGEVDSQATKDAAEKAAKQVDGVGTVRNQLTVKPKG